MYSLIWFLKKTNLIIFARTWKRKMVRNLGYSASWDYIIFYAWWWNFNLKYLNLWKKIREYEWFQMSSRWFN